MPVFDPDMEFRGLMLTIPTWINAIARARGKSNIELVSVSTRNQLTNTLRGLEKEITQDDFVEHLEDDNFFEAYGNPVVIQSKEHGELVCMSYDQSVTT